jgi:5-methylcytosine-specific restriction protein A
VSEPVRRRSLATRERLALFLAAHGRCQRCGWILAPGTRWEVDHVVPLALGGRDHADNMQVLCSPCHGGKTHRIDVPAIARTARIRARHLGARASRRPLPGGRRSRWKKTIDGRILERRQRDSMASTGDLSPDAVGGDHETANAGDRDHGR